jgi:hypothetical protein
MSFWSALFSLAALVNLAVGIGMAVTPAEVAAQLGVDGRGGPYAITMIGMMIAIFGVGYAIVARDPARNRGIVWLGVIGKLGAAVLAAALYAQALIPQSTFMMGMGDLVFAALFALFLWPGRARPSARLAGCG